MSVFAKLLSFGVARGLAALLAVLLSAVGGGRLGLEKLTPELADEERSPVTCPVESARQAAGEAPVLASASRPSMSARQERGALVAHATPAFHPSAPSLLLGSAGGPRAP